MSATLPPPRGLDPDGLDGVLFSRAAPPPRSQLEAPQREPDALLGDPEADEIPVDIDLDWRSGLPHRLDLDLPDEPEHLEIMEFAPREDDLATVMYAHDGPADAPEDAATVCVTSEAAADPEADEPFEILEPRDRPILPLAPLVASAPPGAVARATRPASRGWVLAAATLLVGVGVSGVVGLAALAFLGRPPVEGPLEDVAVAVAAPAPPSATVHAPVDADPVAEPAPVEAAPAPPPVVAEQVVPVRFGLDSAEPRPTDGTALAELVAALAACPGPIVLTGHTCALGADDVNRLVGLERARVTGDALVRAGLPAERVRLETAGSGQPIASNATPEGRAQNRRVTVSCPAP